MILPRPLQRGDTVLLIATARKVSREEMAPAIDIIRNWGFQLEEGKHLYASCNQYAGTDAMRAEDLQWALDHPTAAAILVARGGYGTIRIIDSVSFDGFMRHPKWITGFSDVTVLQSHLFRLGFASLHAPMPVTFARDQESLLSLREAWTGSSMSFSLSSHPLNREGRTSGPVTGGNLSLLYALSGSVSETDVKGCILFIEDLDEYLYHVDRMMMQLKRSGKLAAIAGLVVGGMDDMKDNNVPFGKSAETIIAEAVSDYSYPVAFGFPAGHGKVNMPLCFGKTAELVVTGAAATLKY
jgi:muramoyltetrapeptide carboxypeptidase